jgi:hypothetical protein
VRYSAALMRYRNTRIQVLLLRANDLSFGAENSSKENLGNDELWNARTGALPVNYRRSFHGCL